MIQYSALPTPRRFHQDNSPLRILVGPTRSGTTTAALADVLIRAQEQAPGPDGVRRSRWAIIGPSLSVVKVDLMPLWQLLVPVSIQDGTIARLNLQLGDQKVEAELHFITASDVAAIASLKLTGGVISGDVPETALNALRASTGLYPDNPTHAGIIIEGLFPDPNDWLQSIIHSNPPGMVVFAQPAGDTPEAENTQNLPPGYYEKLINDSPPDWLSRHIQPPSVQRVRVIHICDPHDHVVLMICDVDNGGGFVETEKGILRSAYEEKALRDKGWKYGGGSTPSKPSTPPPDKPSKTLEQIKQEQSQPEPNKPDMRDLGQYRRNRPKPINC